MRTAIITINQDHLRHNLDVIRSKLINNNQHEGQEESTKTRILAMVKSDAYGHGVSAVVPALGAADAFGVATMSEALEVRSVQKTHNLDQPVVLIEGVFSEREWLLVIEHDFGVVIHNQAQLNYALKQMPNAGSFCRTIWLKLNTGMNRLGFGEDEIKNIAKELTDAGYDIILTSHFACSDEKNHPANQAQISMFERVFTHLKTHVCQNVQGSFANSAAIFNFPNVHFDWVRPGIALYGASPMANESATALGLKAVMQFSAKIMATHNLSIGESVGYGCLWTAEKPATIAIVSVGYGDGYPRVVKDAVVKINTNGNTITAPIIGRVAMDMFMIDITGTHANIGDEVILWGDCLPVDDIATCAGTISYELFCKTTKRPARIIK